MFKCAFNRSHDVQGGCHKEVVTPCNGATVWLSTAAVLSIVNFKVRNGDATAVNSQVNCVYLMCASGTGKICEYKIVCAQYEFLEVGGKCVLLFVRVWGSEDYVCITSSKYQRVGI